MVSTPEDLIDTKVDSAKSNDLVFAITGYAGSGTSLVATSLAEKVQAAGYAPVTIKISHLIIRAMEKFGKPIDTNCDALTKANRLQDAGDWLRETHGKSFIAGLGIREICSKRAEAGDLKGKPPLAFILDSLKHPEEERAFRSIYVNGFYSISVICHPEIRRIRLKLKFKGAEPGKLDKFIARDEAADEEHGQQVREALHRGDFFVSNDASEGGAKSGELAAAPLSDNLERFVNIVLRRGLVRPSQEERGMYVAWAASLRSACLSRQVGAAILDANGEVLSTGTNDVPKYGGGLYQDDDKDNDHRCYRWSQRTGAPQCHNDHTKAAIYKSLFEELKGLLVEGSSAADVKSAIGRTRIKDLIEFSRAVHAEMDALISIARNGGSSCRGGSLYCTTYPCHNCARHIVAAGIKEIFYIEPYTKSMAADLHRDSIIEATSTHGTQEDHVSFQLFSGVAPRRFARLFEKRSKLKDKNGIFLSGSLAVEHQDPILTMTFQDFEREIVTRINQIEDAAIQSSGSRDST
jgi:deoxycytidylate deaminase